MISSFISRYMIDQVLNPRVPKVKSGRCLDSLQKKYKCEKCIKICPKGAITFKEDIYVDIDKCDNCNLCVSVCPSGSLIPTYESLEKLYNSFQGKKEVSISCHEIEMETDLKVNCIAAIPWEALAYVAVEEKLRISIKKCRECKKEMLAKEVFNTLEKLRKFLGEDKYLKNVIFIEDPKDIPIREYTRRDLLKLWGHESRRMVNFVLPKESNKNKNSRIYKSFLIKKVEEITEERNNIVFKWPTIKVNEKCWGCGICSKVCPQSAIKVTKENNKGEFQHYYTLCTHCGLCEKICSEGAIEMLVKEEEITNSINSSHINITTCSICGDAIKNNGEEKCIVCKRRNKR